jgi:hypothetical protein
MVEAKGTTPTKTPDAKPGPDKAKAEAASKSVKALAGKKKALQKKDNRPLFYGVALVFAVLLTVVVLSAMKKKTTGGLVRSAKSATGEVTRKARKAGGDSAVAPRKKSSAPRMSAKAQRHAPRAKGLRQRQPVASRPRKERAVRTPTDRTQRSRGQSSRQRTSPNLVTAIGEGSAMIGNRPVHAGDVIRGRVIQEIGADAIKVEYGGAVFSVRIGEALP